MTVHRHSDEWKRVIATAALAGVTFQRVRPIYYGNHERYIGHGFMGIFWRATLPAGGNIEAPSKYEAALKALRILDGLPPQAQKREGKDER